MYECLLPYMEGILIKALLAQLILANECIAFKM